ncbi:hypothetical protein UQW22_09910 [Isoptericola halotolerans]|uniref:hypothetical protein n=1 Tax=Isoptericola halotolerans TaxID=300560 RepID=UPI00388DA111
MNVKFYTNKKTRGLQKVREGSRLHKLVAKSEYYSEVSKAKADAQRKASTKADEKPGATGGTSDTKADEK